MKSAEQCSESLCAIIPPWCTLQSLFHFVGIAHHLLYNHHTHFASSAASREIVGAIVRPEFTRWSSKRDAAVASLHDRFGVPSVQAHLDFDHRLSLALHLLCRKQTRLFRFFLCHGRI
jgi:hypothetical protein